MSGTVGLTTTSKAGPCSSWSLLLHTVLIPAPRIASFPCSSNYHNPRHTRHLPGLLWKQTLGRCVYHDLLDEEEFGILTRQRRRFARLESIGLSGVVLYEIPPRRDANNDYLSVNSMLSDEPHLTLKGVFGDPNDANEPGMNVDQLLDCVGARVIYFPSYACTSFIVGSFSAFSRIS
ncbi:hypothetical protein AMATHDRAFT_152706 [Amanita thiersii Skay4041]|uniref:Uncharacterized protein n=1 Tax=Amanita thiersii Skay4041 TaxID=703135 RepID=A0A2A9NHL6_9AGAR|nr:hypothetical protein AMATHDRAFT_152706 [Amanita thiersii Skay4041]